MKNQIKSGVILSYIAQIIQILISLIYTPIVLKLLGQNEYGLYQLASSIIGYLSILNVGFGSAYLRYANKYVRDNDEDGFNRLNGLFLIIFLITAGITLMAGAVLTINARVVFGNNLSNAEIYTAKILLGIMTINLAVGLLDSVFSSIQTFHEKFIFMKGLLILQTIFNPFIALPLMLLGYGSVGMVVATTLITVIKFIVDICFCIRKLKVKFVFNKLDWKLFFSMGSYTFFIFLNSIIKQINWSVDKLLIGRIIGTGAVAIYGIGSTINNIYMNCANAISNIFVPKVNHLILVDDDTGKSNELFTKIGRFQFYILSLILIEFIFFGKVFIKLWAGYDYELAYYVALILMIADFVPKIQVIGVHIQRAKNRHRVRSIVFIGIAVINVLISIPLIKYYGVVGASFGTLICIVVGDWIWMNWYYHTRLDIDVISYWKSMAKNLPSLLPCILLGFVANRFLLANNIISLVLNVLAVLLAYIISVWFLALKKEEKEQVINGLKNKRNSK